MEYDDDDEFSSLATMFLLWLQYHEAAVTCFHIKFKFEFKYLSVTVPRLEGLCRKMLWMTLLSKLWYDRNTVQYEVYVFLVN
jgi:hypothetical protein